MDNLEKERYLHANMLLSLKHRVRECEEMHKTEVEMLEQESSNMRDIFKQMVEERKQHSRKHFICDKDDFIKSTGIFQTDNTSEEIELSDLRKIEKISMEEESIENRTFFNFFFI